MLLLRHYWNALSWGGLFAQNKGRGGHLINQFIHLHFSLFFFLIVFPQFLSFVLQSVEKWSLCLCITQALFILRGSRSKVTDMSFQHITKSLLVMPRLPLKLPSSVQDFLEGWWFLSSDTSFSSGRAVKRGGGTREETPLAQDQHTKGSSGSLKYGENFTTLRSKLYRQCLIFSEKNPFSMVQDEFLNYRDSPQLDYLKIRRRAYVLLRYQITHLSSKSLPFQGRV